MTDKEKAFQLQEQILKDNDKKARDELYMLLLKWGMKNTKALCRKLKIYIDEEEIYDLANDRAILTFTKHIDNGKPIRNFQIYLWLSISNMIRDRGKRIKKEEEFYNAMKEAMKVVGDYNENDLIEVIKTIYNYNERQTM